MTAARIALPLCRIRVGLSIGYDAVSQAQKGMPPTMNAPVSPARSVPTATPMVAREDRESIALLRLNRPDSRNALSQAMIEALLQAFAEIAADGAVRAVVLSAEGPAFSAGHDLKEITAHRRDPDGG